MRIRRVIAVALGLVTLATGDAWGQQPPAFEEAASQLQTSVVTVRVSLFPAELAANETRADNEPSAYDGSPKPSAAADRPTAARSRVTVCSGVLLGQGRLITPAFAASDSAIRITLPAGEQLQARLRVIDEYSGLSLLQVDRTDLPAIDLADELPAVGAWILAGAAWGVEKPVVSLGIISGHDRNLAGMSYPPLIQCSLPTADTSSGAGLVDQEGRLLGIIVAADSDPARRGWAYAVPVRHVRRLLRAADNATDEHTVIVLKRFRPEVGMILEGNEDQIHVTRVHPGSPAEKAGIQVGDQILQADGTTIRSVYQALRPVLNRQPGDVIIFRVRQQDAERDIEVVLGGGIVMPSAPFQQLGQVIRPKVDIDGLENGQVVINRNPGGSIREVNMPPADSLDPPANASMAEKIKLLEKALDGYRSVIVYQQSQLSESQQQRARNEELIRQLQAELEQLKRQAKD